MNDSVDRSNSTNVDSNNQPIKQQINNELNTYQEIQKYKSNNPQNFCSQYHIDNIRLNNQLNNKDSNIIHNNADLITSNKFSNYENYLNYNRNNIPNFNSEGIFEIF